MSDLRKRALDLYKGPFRFDGISYIWDANGEMVADGKIDEDIGPRVRGWGRMKYLKDTDALFVETGHALAEALTIGWKALRAKDPT